MYFAWTFYIQIEIYRVKNSSNPINLKKKEDYEKKHVAIFISNFSINLYDLYDIRDEKRRKVIEMEN